MSDNYPITTYKYSILAHINMVANYAFLIVIFFAVIGTINTHQPLSNLTLNLILFIVPVVLVFTWYTSGGDRIVKLVLNRNKHNLNHGNTTNKNDTNSVI